MTFLLWHSATTRCAKDPMDSRNVGRRLQPRRDPPHVAASDLFRRQLVRPGHAFFFDYESFTAWEMRDEDGNLTKTSLPVTTLPSTDASWPAVPRAPYDRGRLLQQRVGSRARRMMRTLHDLPLHPEGWQASRNIGPDDDRPYARTAP